MLLETPVKLTDEEIEEFRNLILKEKDGILSDRGRKRLVTLENRFYQQPCTSYPKCGCMRIGTYKDCGF